MKQFKIAFIGNVNCMTFRYALEVRRLGHDVVFFVDYPRSEKLHRPENRFSEITFPYPDWIREIRPPRRDISFLVPVGEIKELITELNSGGYDAVVFNGCWHKIGVFISRRTRVLCFFSGADLDVKASYKAVLHAKHSTNVIAHYVKTLLRLCETWLHRRGIRRASLINYFPEGVVPAADRLINEIMKGRDFHRIQVRGLTVDDVEYSPPSTRVGADVVIFNPTRFLWKNPLPLGYAMEENKRNDIMLRGIATFYNKTGLAIKVVLVEKGAQLTETKALIDELGIAHLVSWRQEMSQKEIFQHYQDSDVIFDQLGIHWVGHGGLDAMLVGRPVIANGRPDVFNKILGETIPLCQATNEEEVADWLAKLAMNPELRKEIGLRSREFVIRNFNATDTARQIVKHLE